jgi:hypothetical protein
LPRAQVAARRTLLGSMWDSGRTFNARSAMISA